MRLLCSARFSAVAVLGILSAAAAQDAPKRILENGRVSISLQGCPLRLLLEQLAWESQVAIELSEEIGDDTVTVELKDVPLDHALRTVVARYDSFFYYQAHDAGPPRLRSVWVYPMGAAKAIRPVPPRLWAGARELEANLSDPDPEVREQAYGALMEHPQGRSRGLLAEALRGRETDEALRQRVLSTAISKGTALEPGVLADLARSDRSDQIRWMALDALSQHESAREVAEVLRTDPSDPVRQKAAEILGQLNAAARPSRHDPEESELQQH